MNERYMDFHVKTKTLSVSLGAFLSKGFIDIGTLIMVSLVLMLMYACTVRQDGSVQYGLAKKITTDQRYWVDKMSLRC